jgi:enoyl-CoA hydratase/carnithine racemase
MSISYHSDQGIATLCFDRPAKKNAITAEMYEQFVAGLKQAAADPSVRVVIVSGAGGSFTAGNDLKDFSNPRFAQPDSPVIGFMQGLAAFEKPVIAAVQGLAVGIGVTMLLHCDLVYVSDEARLALPFVSLGLVPEFGSSLLLPLLMGPVRAAEKLLLGDPFGPQDAVDCGIANAVLPAAEVVPHARRMAERFNTLPPEAVRETKRLMRKARGAALAQARDDENAVFGQRLRSPEAREAFTAFFEKRRPDFTKF